MSNILVQLTGAQWVNPDEIVAIHWNASLMDECPQIILRNGHRMNATGFSEKQYPAESPAEITERLLRHISRARLGAAT